MATQTENPKLSGKIFIKGKIKVVTGLHIGGSKSDLDIGGVDLAVIKTSDRKRMPFIPGSSLKGKLRTMLARAGGYMVVDDDSDLIKSIFGYGADGNKEDEEDKDRLPTRLIVRDAMLDEQSFHANFDREDLDTRYTMVKWENTINRKTGTAEHPRQIERVPAGAQFSFEMIYNVFEDGQEKAHMDAIKEAMNMLQDDYLGGHGTRGYGQIAFQEVAFHRRTKANYEQGQAAQLDTTYTWNT
ncbi:MAG: type III-A CRISPR-associated RAMP protein Csm3 [Bacteroidota bacterium]